MSVIFWDTNLFIYLIEQTYDLHERVANFRRKMIDDKDRLVTSTLTLGELLVKPLKENRQDIAEQYRSLLTSQAITLIHFDELVAERYAKIRAKNVKLVKPPDAIQLACASSFGVDLFITNDKRLNGIKIDQVKRIASLVDVV